MKKLLSVLVMLMSLSSCVFIVGAAAGAVAVAAVYDHRKIEKVVLDQKTNNEVVRRINLIPHLQDNGHINVTTFNHVVLLTGQVTSAALKEQAEQTARLVPDVDKVYNLITLQGPTSPLTRASDSWITTKVKTQMLASKDLASGSIKVLTENGTVYLLGTVTQEQADLAVEIARTVTGVQKVIKIFQYKS